MPPSTAIICPVIQDAASDNRKVATFAISSGVPILFNGCLLAAASDFSGEDNNFSAKVVFVREGAIAFTRTL